MDWLPGEEKGNTNKCQNFILQDIMQMPLQIRLESLSFWLLVIFTWEKFTQTDQHISICLFRWDNLCHTLQVLFLLFTRDTLDKLINFFLFFLFLCHLLLSQNFVNNDVSTFLFFSFYFTHIYVLWILPLRISCHKNDSKSRCLDLWTHCSWQLFMSCC